MFESRVTQWYLCAQHLLKKNHWMVQEDAKEILKKGQDKKQGYEMQHRVKVTPYQFVPLRGA